MKRKPYIIGILAAGLALTAAVDTSGYSRIVTSARSFRHYFHAMQSTVGSLGPVERFVYSVVLASSQSEQSPKHLAPHLPRT
jgi:hypothetical protein